jgi:hypothetical protein
MKYLEDSGSESGMTHRRSKMNYGIGIAVSLERKILHPYKICNDITYNYVLKLRYKNT